jgi:hypothetical protein
MKTKQLLQEIKGVFKPPKKRYYFGKLQHGSPYYTPTPKVCMEHVGLGWKDKYFVPIMEWAPQFHIRFFNLQFVIWWEAPDGNSDLYYEMILWWLNYSNKDIVKAEKTWGWTDYNTKKSTWNKDYLV